MRKRRRLVYLFRGICDRTDRLTNLYGFGTDDTRRYIGWTDVPLTSKGEEEARQAGAILKYVRT